MAFNKKPIYKRVLVKLSGEFLKGKKKFGIDTNMIDYIVQEIKELTKINIQVSIVIGGGNFFRGTSLREIGISQIVGDHIGILSTIINGLAIYDAFQRAHENVYLMSAISCKGICDIYNWIKAINLLNTNYIVILSAGTGNPFFTTDSAACLRGIEIQADIILKATKVDGVFTDDPIKNPSAIMYDQLSYSEVLEKKLKIMDVSSFTLARDHKLPIRVFNINKIGAMRRIVFGEKEGTLIKE